MRFRNDLNVVRLEKNSKFVKNNSVVWYGQIFLGAIWLIHWSQHVEFDDGLFNDFIYKIRGVAIKVQCLSNDIKILLMKGFIGQLKNLPCEHTNSIPFIRQRQVGLKVKVSPGPSGLMVPISDDISVLIPNNFEV
jgi:hypothetical protein